MASLGASQIGFLAARYGADKVANQARQESVMLSEKVITEFKRVDQYGYVNLRTSGVEASTMVDDYSSLPSGGEAPMTQVKYFPKGFMSRLKVPRIAAKTVKSTKDGIGLVFEQMNALSEDIASLLDRAILKTSLGSPASTQVSTDTSISLTDWLHLDTGKTLDIYNSSGVLKGSVVVASPPNPTSSPATVTLKNQIGFAVATDDVVYIRGGGNTSNVQFADFTLAASDSQSLYSQATTSYNWKGVTDSSTTTLNAQNVKRFLNRIRKEGGKFPDVIVCDVDAEQTIYESLDDNIRYMGSGGDMDQFAKTIKVGRTPIVVNNNCPRKHLFAINKKYSKLHCFVDFEAEVDGDKGAGKGLGAAIVSQSDVSYDVQFLGIFQMRHERRNTLGVMTALSY